MIKPVSWLAAGLTLYGTIYDARAEVQPICDSRAFVCPPEQQSPSHTPPYGVGSFAPVVTGTGGHFVADSFTQIIARSSVTGDELFGPATWPDAVEWGSTPEKPSITATQIARFLTDQAARKPT